jgi:hypothetical protein
MGVMKASQRYREIATQCLAAARATRDPDSIKLHLSMAASWISLARQDEATADLLASWNVPNPVETTSPAACAMDRAVSVKSVFNS